MLPLLQRGVLRVGEYGDAGRDEDAWDQARGGAFAVKGGAGGAVGAGVGAGREEGGDSGGFG